MIKDTVRKYAEMQEEFTMNWNQYYTSMRRKQGPEAVGLEDIGDGVSSLQELEGHLAFAGPDEGIVYELRAGREYVPIHLHVEELSRLKPREDVVLAEDHGRFRLVATVVRPIPPGIRPGTYTFLYSPTYGCGILPRKMFEDGDVPRHLLSTNDRNSR